MDRPKRRSSQLGRPAKPSEITPDPEFAALIPSLGGDEKEQLLSSLLNEGCPEPLYVWKWNDQLVLLIGYRLFPLLRLHSIPFRIIEKTFPHRDAARLFVVHYFLGRRLLTPLALRYLRGLRFREEKPQRGGDRKSQDFRQRIGHRLTAEALAKNYHVDRSVIFKDAQFAIAVESLVALSDESIKPLLFAREGRLSWGRIIALSKLPPGEIRRHLHQLRLFRRLPAMPRTEPARMTLPVEPLALAAKLVEKGGAEYGWLVQKALLRVLQDQQEAVLRQMVEEEAPLPVGETAAAS